jgi:hypothetical protein
MSASLYDILVLFQHKGDVDVAPKARRRLWVTGRNIRHFGGYVLESAGSGFYIVGANTALVRTPYQQRILDVLQNAPEGATPTWIAQQISGDKNERSHVFRALQSMQKQGLVGCVQTRWFTVEQLVAHERGKRARR